MIKEENSPINKNIIKNKNIDEIKSHINSFPVVSHYT